MALVDGNLHFPPGIRQRLSQTSSPHRGDPSSYAVKAVPEHPGRDFRQEVGRGGRAAKK